MNHSSRSLSTIRSFDRYSAIQVAAAFSTDAQRAAQITSLSISASIRKDNEPARLIDLDDELFSNAAIDGLWQLLMLAGAVEADFLSYETSTYYGMIVATYAPMG